MNSHTTVANWKIHNSNKQDIGLYTDGSKIQVTVGFSVKN